MIGRQNEIYSWLLVMAERIQDGFYGIGDKFNDVRFGEDVEEALCLLYAIRVKERSLKSEATE